MRSPHASSNGEQRGEIQPIAFALTNRHRHRQHWHRIGQCCVQNLWWISWMPWGYVQLRSSSTHHFMWSSYFLNGMWRYIRAEMLPKTEPNSFVPLLFVPSFAFLIAYTCTYQVQWRWMLWNCLYPKVLSSEKAILRTPFLSHWPSPDPILLECLLMVPDNKLVLSSLVIQRDKTHTLHTPSRQQVSDDNQES